MAVPSLVKVLDGLESSALEFCSQAEWCDVKAHVIAAGSIPEANATARDVLAKAARRSFASRSEAARYAAGIRWGSRGGQSAGGSVGGAVMSAADSAGTASLIKAGEKAAQRMAEFANDVVASQEYRKIRRGSSDDVNVSQVLDDLDAITTDVAELPPSRIRIGERLTNSLARLDQVQQDANSLSPGLFNTVENAVANVRREIVQLQGQL